MGTLHINGNFGVKLWEIMREYCTENLSFLFTLVTTIHLKYISSSHRPWHSNTFIEWDELSISLYYFLFSSTTVSNSSRHFTLAPTLAQSKKAPLNFLWREYVSLGGGVNRCFNIVGINALTRAVTSCLEKSYTSGALMQKGSANVRIESIWAFNIDCIQLA